jgi:hypothetical protein
MTFDPDPRVSLFGQPVSKSLVFQTREGLAEYQDEYESKLRFIIDTIASYTWIDVGKLITVACSQIINNSTADRGKAAWHTLAWHEMFEKGEHSKMYVREDRLMRVVTECPAALYYYGIFVVQSPNQNVYARLKQLDDSIALNYVRFCLACSFSHMGDRSLFSLSNWGAHSPDVSFRN